MPRSAKGSETRKRDEFLDAIGKKIRQHRLMAGLTQKELAAKLKASSSWVYLVEDGQQNAQIHSLRRLAELFNTSISSLLPDEIRPDADSNLEPEISSSFNSLIDDLTRSLATAHKLNVLRRKR